MLAGLFRELGMLHILMKGLTEGDEVFVRTTYNTALDATLRPYLGRG